MPGDCLAIVPAWLLVSQQMGNPALPVAVLRGLFFLPPGQSGQQGIRSRNRQCRLNASMVTWLELKVASSSRMCGWGEALCQSDCRRICFNLGRMQLLLFLCAVRAFAAGTSHHGM